MTLVHVLSSFERLLVVVLILLVSLVQADMRELGFSTEGKPQPIGIDFGAEAVFAMYAHSRTHLTLLGAVIPNQTYHQGYSDMVSLIRLQNQQRTERMNILLGAGGLKSSSPTFSDILIATKPQLKVLTRKEIKQEFTGILEALQFQAYEKERLKIDFAIISVPDYFNATIKRILLDACRESGISTVKSVIERPIAAIPAVDHKADARLLMIDHGAFHFTIMTAKANHDKINKPISSTMVPLDIFGSHAVDFKIAKRLETRNKAIKDHLSYGARLAQLQSAIRNARMLMKDNIDAEYLGLGVDEDHHHEEWPLDLRGWWVGYEQPTVTLNWKDVEAVEDEYIEQLSDTLTKFLIATRQGYSATPNTDNAYEVPKQEIDTVLILTDQLDGGLIRRAVRQAIGDYVPLRGGFVNNITIAAEGAAVMAFRRGEQWEKVQLYNLGLGEEPVCYDGL
ncbi:hypothetical protein B7463_g3740, partial [Scytalidium lignicola]